mmetsp:Transcript_22126/g.70700  ORF Transcript_22126/g.70700 Transcript_22126/m.70700 type:complete len:255 (+) Transcript_22126:700-1464(+)
MKKTASDIRTRKRVTSSGVAATAAAAAMHKRPQSISRQMTPLTRAASRAAACCALCGVPARLARERTASVSTPPSGVPSTPPTETAPAKAREQAACEWKEPKPSRKTGPYVEMPITVAVSAAYPSTRQTYDGEERRRESCAQRVTAASRGPPVAQLPPAAPTAPSGRAERAATASYGEGGGGSSCCCSGAAAASSEAAAAGRAERAEAGGRRKASAAKGAIAAASRRKAHPQPGPSASRAPNSYPIAVPTGMAV